MRAYQVLGIRCRRQIAEDQARRLLQDAESAARLLQKAERAVREAIELERAGEKEGQQAQFASQAALMAAPTGRRSTGILQRATPSPSARSMSRGRSGMKSQQGGGKQATAFRVGCLPPSLSGTFHHALSASVRSIFAGSFQPDNHS